MVYSNSMDIYSNSMDKKYIHLFFGHQNRTKGYIIDVFDKLSTETIYPPGKKPRFSNGSILELKIMRSPQNEIELFLSLPYTGDYSGNKNSEYWVGTDYNGNDKFIPVPFGTKSITITSDQLFKSFKINPSIIKEGIQIICYFVRHGYSTHNVSGMQRLFSYTGKSAFNTNTSLTGKDDRTKEILDSATQSFKGGDGDEDEVVEGEVFLTPQAFSPEDEVVEGKVSLTPQAFSPADIAIQKKIGTEQALQAGIKFSQILGDQKLDSICVSDLIRTHQTAEYFLKGLLEFKPNALDNISKIYVLPCFHELQKNGRDEDTKITNNLTRAFTLGQTQGLLNRENNTNCRNDVDFNKTRYSGKQRNNCGSIQVNGKIITLDWGFYKSIYYGKYRDQFETEFSTKRNPCIDNNFLGIFLNYFAKIPSGGKTRKHKKNNKTHKNNKKISKKNKFIHRNTRKHKYY